MADRHNKVIFFPQTVWTPLYSTILLSGFPAASVGIHPLSVWIILLPLLTFAVVPHGHRDQVLFPTKICLLFLVSHKLYEPSVQNHNVQGTHCRLRAGGRASGNSQSFLVFQHDNINFWFLIFHLQPPACCEIVSDPVSCVCRSTCWRLEVAAGSFAEVFI